MTEPIKKIRKKRTVKKKIVEEKRPKGRPKIVLTPKDYENIKKMAALKLSQHDIANILKISHGTMDTLIAEGKKRFEAGDRSDDNIFWVMEYGKTNVHKLLKNKALKLALIKENPQMIVFLLKALYNVTEKIEVEHSGNESKPIKMELSAKEIAKVTTALLEASQKEGIKFE
jgi:predicted DNA-binding protein (UPF0251 family)